MGIHTSDTLKNNDYHEKPTPVQIFKLDTESLLRTKKEPYWISENASLPQIDDLSRTPVKNLVHNTVPPKIFPTTYTTTKNFRPSYYVRNNKDFLYSLCTLSF